METYFEIAAPIVTFDTSHAVIGRTEEDREVDAFSQTMADYKRRSGRQFPTWSEILEVLRGLGYTKPDLADASLTGAVVRVNAVGSLGDRIRTHLLNCGGKPIGPTTQVAYEFSNESLRGDAMASVRRRFGWTCVDPE